MTVPEGRALVVAAYGLAYVLVWQGCDAIVEYIADCAGAGIAEPFAAAKASLDHAPLTDGVWIADLKMIDDGEGDWPGTREYALSLVAPRLATNEEWAAHLADEWPWPSLEVARALETAP
jgi:hypothetical protein